MKGVWEAICMTCVACVAVKRCLRVWLNASVRVRSPFFRLLVCGWLSILFLVSPLFSTPTAWAKTPLPQHVHLVALGDSITAGWGSPPVNGGRLNGYVGFLHRQLLTRGTSDLNNLGVPGITSGQLLFLLDHWPEASQTIKQANVITLSIGGNDIMWTEKQSPDDMLKMREALGKYEENIRLILAKIRAYNPTARLFVLEVYNPFPTDDARHNMLTEWIQWVNESIAKAAYEQDADVVPVASLFLKHEKEYVNLANNDIHPNTEGHEQIAAQISHTLFGTFIPLLVDKNNAPNLLWNGKPTDLPAGLLYENNTVYIEEAQLTHLYRDRLKKIWTRVGAWWALVNGKTVKLQSPVILKDGRPYVPLRAVSESLGAQVFWVEESKTISVVMELGDKKMTWSERVGVARLWR